MSESRSHSPWISIWVRPRATIARIVTENPNRSLWLLAAIYGFSSVLNLFQSASLGSFLGPLPILILALILSPFWGYATFAIWSWVVMWTGKIFKGRGDFPTIRAAYAWSCVPLIINVPLWLLMIVLFGQELFLNFPEGHLLSQGQITLLFLILIAKVVLAIWSLIIYLNTLAEVQQYSILRAILNVIVAAILLGIVLGLLWMLALFALGASAQPTMTTFQLWNDGIQLESLRKGL
ncbi:MAG: YIP1 family protein [Chlamydiota bacterium]